MQPNCPPESGGQRHRVLCDDARGGSPNEMFQNAFLKSAAQEPPPARSRLLTQEGSSAGLDASGVPQCLRLTPILGSTNLEKTNLDRYALGEGFRIIEITIALALLQVRQCHCGPLPLPLPGSPDLVRLLRWL